MIRHLGCVADRVVVEPSRSCRVRGVRASQFFSLLKRKFKEANRFLIDLSIAAIIHYYVKLIPFIRNECIKGR